jgi:hypothetical protein
MEKREANYGQFFLKKMVFGVFLTRFMTAFGRKWRSVRLFGFQLPVTGNR